MLITSCLSLSFFTVFSLTVEADFCCLRNTTGFALVSLFTQADAWLKDKGAVQSKKLALTGERLNVKFENVAPGHYAIAMVHDENNNGQLDMQWFPPQPAEGTGMSNNAVGRFGPPRFADAVFPVYASVKQTIHVNY